MDKLRRRHEGTGPVRGMRDLLLRRSRPRKYIKRAVGVAACVVVLSVPAYGKTKTVLVFYVLCTSTVWKYVGRFCRFSC